MQTLRFTKMSGAGNDFVLIDAISGSGVVVSPELVAALCRRRRGVGADGVLIVTPPQGPEDFSMRYYNADGSEADLCGNGARCVALYAYVVGIAGKEMKFSSRAGVHAARITAGGVAVGMPEPEDGPRAVKLEWGSESRVGLFLVVGVPPVVFFVDDVRDVAVEKVGRRVRCDSALAPDGANVDFVQVVDRQHLKLRTYERGVEAETLACGTGAVASAAAACFQGRCTFPVRIETSGGDVLSVHGNLTDGRFESLELEGPALVVFEGTWKGGP